MIYCEINKLKESYFIRYELGLNNEGLHSFLSNHTVFTMEKYNVDIGTLKIVKVIHN